MLSLRLYQSFALALLLCACGNAGTALNDINTAADGDSRDVASDADLDAADGETLPEDSLPDGDPDLDEFDRDAEQDFSASDGDFDERSADHELEPFPLALHSLTHI